jgi:hypothetical protein
VDVGAEAVENGENRYLKMMEQCRGSRILKELQTHENEKVRANATDLFQKLCSGRPKKWVWRKKKNQKKDVDPTRRNANYRFSPVRR